MYKGEVDDQRNIIMTIDEKHAESSVMFHDAASVTKQCQPGIVDPGDDFGVGDYQACTIKGRKGRLPVYCNASICFGDIDGVKKAMTWPTAIACTHDACEMPYPDNPARLMIMNDAVLDVDKPQGQKRAVMYAETGDPIPQRIEIVW